MDSGNYLLPKYFFRHGIEHNVKYFYVSLQIIYKYL